MRSQGTLVQMPNIPCETQKEEASGTANLAPSVPLEIFGRNRKLNRSSQIVSAAHGLSYLGGHSTGEVKQPVTL